MTAPARTGWLAWLVVESAPDRHPWVVAQFDVRDDAVLFAASKNTTTDDRSYTVEADPDFARLLGVGRV